MSEAAAPGGSRSGAGVARILSDDRLALRATKGDRRAFAAIYRRYHQSLYRFCLAIVGDPQDAQDALQNTMVKALRALPGEERRIQLKPWLYRIAHNESVELLRRRQGTEQLDPALATPAAGPAEEAALRERLRRLISDLDDLPERQRGALVMRELAGLGFAEIGASLGTSSAVARQTVYEARLSLRQMEAGREMSCTTVTKALSDADGRVTRRRDIRAHLRTCASCRSFRDELDGRRHDFAALAPLPAAAATGLLHGILGGHGGSNGGGLAGALGAGGGKALGASAVVKSAATVAVVAAVGISAADRAGLIHVGLAGNGGSQAARTQPPGGAGQAAAQRTGTGVGPAQRRAAAKGAVGTFHPAAAARGGSAPIGQPPDAGAGSAAAPSPHGSSASQHGRGHRQELPATAAQGQQMAATHKGAGHGASSAHGHPPKPPHPAHASNPGAKKAHASPSPSSGSRHEAPAPHSPNSRGAAPPQEPGAQP
ncbi:MAG TPA: sigma-70 family RNA polymerase sigma factor [Solirubrobacterales bacterium]|jgi:RNA polymerase sigma factor (sigma-70 family)|nr:sigma-70 family RNA polymerase sigma factor [Solirubrobacterales bacterium]